MKVVVYLTPDEVRRLLIEAAWTQASGFVGGHDCKAAVTLSSYGDSTVVIERQEHVSPVAEA